jgi:ferric enterobactin receptor
MRRSTLAVSAIILAFLPASALAQAPGGPGQQPPAARGEVRGLVTDEGNQPVGHASIAVRSKRDSSLVTGAIANPDGTFRIQGLRNGAYFLRVTMIGFAPRFQDVTITDDAPLVRAPVTLARIAVSLESVAVTAEREAVTIEPDRNSYRARDVAPAAANASDVLDAVPSVQVEHDGKVSLRGNENVAVQINGRPSPIRGAQLGAYLKTLPANVVERVEVIPNPSAKFDPEGMAGIINIVLRQNADLGWSAGLNVGAANTDRYNASGNVGYQRGRLTLFNSFGYNNDGRNVVGINERERYNSLQALTSVTEQDIDGETAFGGKTLTSSADVRLNSRDVLSNSLTLNMRDFTNASLSNFTERDGAMNPTSTYQRLSDSDNEGWLLDYNAAFKRTFEPRKHELSTELRFIRNAEEDATSLWRQPMPGSGTTRTENEINTTDALTQQAIAQVDYTKTLAARTKLESGYKGTARWLDRDYIVRKDNDGNGTWENSNLSNNFEFDEQVHALYGVMSHGLGKFELQGGLRAEHASRDFKLGSTGENYPYNYTSLFPSGVAMYSLSDATQLKASYSRRIRRPGTQELNPFPSFFDVQNVFIGNPQLSPEYTDAIELGLTRNMTFGTLQFQPFYRRTTNVIRVDIDTEAQIDGRDVTAVSFRNLATSNSFGADLNSTVRLGQKFSGFASFNVFRMVTDGGSTSALSSDAIGWATRVNGTVTLSPKTTFQGSYFYRAPMAIERGKFSAQQMANLSMRYKVDERSALTLRAVDPFNTMGMKIRTGNDNLIQLTERKFGVRGVFLNYQFTYGQAPRVRQPRPQEQEQPSTGFPQ